MSYLLTEKSERDFFNYYYKGIKWNDEDVDMFYEDNEIQQYAYIVDWLDSVGVYITIMYSKIHSVTGFNWRLNNSVDYYGTETLRIEATKQAIITANKLYNESRRITNR